MFNILQNSYIRNDTSCRHDSSVGWSVVWNENEDYKDYTEVSGATSTVVWDDNYFMATTSGVVYISPDGDQTPFDAGTYSKLRIKMRIEESSTTNVIPTTGRVQFQTQADPFFSDERQVDFDVSVTNSYDDYIVDMSEIREWSGNVSRIRLFPFIDGAEGYIVHIKSIEAFSDSTFSCDTINTDNICSKYYEYYHPCPWVGEGGSCSSKKKIGGFYTIEKGVNDKLLIDINGYDVQSIVLNPIENGSIEDIARDIEDKLSNIPYAGFFGNKVVIEDYRLKIIADDTRESSSYVNVLDNELSRYLGFYTSSGQFEGVKSLGEDSASRYEPRGTIQLSKSQIASIYSDSKESPKVEFDTGRYSLRGGREDFYLGYFDVKLDFSDKLAVDFNNPINNTGILEYVAFSGDASSSTEFKILRPRANGKLEVIHSLNMGLDEEVEDSTIELNVSWRVRRGDLLAVYDCKVARGKKQDIPNGSYYIYEGNPEEGDSIEADYEFRGKGEQGIRLFARGHDRETEAYLQVDFDKLELLENVYVEAEEEQVIEYVNLSRVKSGGINGGPNITVVVGKDKFGNQAPSFSNLGALTDGVSLNTINTQYFYPSWEDTTYSPNDLYDQTEFSITLDFAKGVNVFFNIDRFKIYFRDKFNVKYFGLEYPVTTDPEDVDIFWGPVTDTYNQVYIEGKPFGPDDHPIYSNPIQPNAANFLDSYQSLEYGSLEFEFRPVKARSIRYNVKNYAFNEEEHTESYSNYTLAPSAYISEIEVFAKSIPDTSITDNFYFESSRDGVNYYQHSNVDSLGNTSSRYLIGYPVKSLRIKIVPQGKMTLYSMSADSSEGNTKLLGARSDGKISLELRQGKEDVQKVDIENKSTDSSIFYVDIAHQKQVSDRCVLWNKLSSISTTAVSELGPSPVVEKRDDYFLREFNYSYLCKGYTIDPFWLLNRQCVSYISYDSGQTWKELGTRLTDYNINTYTTAISPQFGSHPFVYILIDLGQIYDLDNIQAYNNEDVGEVFNGPSFSGLDVDSVESLDIFSDFLTSKESCRWVLFSAPSRFTTETEPENISYIEVGLDVVSFRNKSKIPWVEAPGLTNYVTANRNPNSYGEGWSSSVEDFSNWYLLDLNNHLNISNITIGPQLDNFSSKDFDVLEPGDIGSLFSSTSKANNNVFYSQSNIDSPFKLTLSNLPNTPSSNDRWVLIKSEPYVIDEIIVHINDNIQKDKPSFGNELWWQSSIGSVERDFSETIEGPSSISWTLPESSGLEKFYIEQSFGIDHVLSRRDNFRILLYIEDVSQLDSSDGYIRIGRGASERQTGVSPWSDGPRDSVNYYNWPMSSIYSLLENGWNEIYLPFSDNFKVGEPYFTKDDGSNWGAEDISGKSRFRWIEFAFSGGSTNSSIDIKVQGPKVVRGYYTPGNFGNALYLSGNEYAKFYLNNINTLEGTVEFYLNPEWSKDPQCNTCEDPVDHSIFRLFNDDNFSVALYMTGKGLRAHLSPGKDKHYFATDNSNSTIVLGENTHIAVTWDVLGTRGNDALNIYINGRMTSSIRRELVTDSFKPNTVGTLLLGGNPWDGIVGRKSGSVNGSVENIKLYNYAKKDFEYSMNNQGLEYVRPPEELIEVSKDGVNFFSSSDRGKGALPLRYEGVLPGETFSVFVRNRNNTNFENGDSKNKTVFLEVVRTV